MIVEDTNSDTVTLTFDVKYTFEMTVNDKLTVQDFCYDGNFAKACAYLMKKYRVSLVEANCIRKCIAQQTYEFNCDLRPAEGRAST